MHTGSLTAGNAVKPFLHLKSLSLHVKYVIKRSRPTEIEMYYNAYGKFDRWKRCQTFSTFEIT